MTNRQRKFTLAPSLPPGQTRWSRHVFIFTIVLLASAGTWAQQPPITVAVMPFEFRGGGQWSNIDVGEQLTALVTDNLARLGDYDVLERARIDQILKEQDFGMSGSVDPSRAAEIGRLLGADALIFGTVTKFEFSSSGSLGVFGISLSGTSAGVDLTGRIVDTSQGVILGSVAGSGSATGASLSVDSFKDISFSASQFQETSLGKATYRAVDEFVDDLADVIQKNTDRIRAAKSRASLSGVVVQVLDSIVILNIGENDGVLAEQRFAVSRLLDVPGLAEPVRVPVGSLRIISVDPTASVAMVETQTQPIQAGDVVAVQ